MSESVSSAVSVESLPRIFQLLMECKEGSFRIYEERSAADICAVMAASIVTGKRVGSTAPHGS